MGRVYCPGGDSFMVYLGVVHGHFEPVGLGLGFVVFSFVAYIINIILLKKFPSPCMPQRKND